ncbi:MAG: peroxiredoxin [Planctomycetes bacterium]|nr:peroxiredoxin [Planctomycetota bacterium]
MLKPGDPAPSFRVQDHTGREVSLEEHRGKRVVLWFYPKADTPGCTREGCNFRDLHADYQAKGAAVLGISYDTPAENAAFVEKYRLSYPLLCDTDKKVAQAYGAFDPAEPGYPRRNTYVIDPEGRVERVLEAVNPKTHPRDLLDSLA